MNQLSGLLNHHRSIRRYKLDPIDAALIEKVCGDAIGGGSSSGTGYPISARVHRRDDLMASQYKNIFALGGSIAPRK
jgi:hypothetical protein